MAVPIDKIYTGVQSGKIDPTKLSSEYKQQLREYIVSQKPSSKKQISASQPMVMGRFKELEYAPPPQRSLGERISRGAHLVAGGLAKGATLGLVGPGAPIDIDRIIARVTGQPAPAPITPETRGEKIAAGVGELGGAIVPISKLYGAGTAVTQRLIPKATSLFAAESAVTSAGRAALPGVAAGTVYEGGKAAIEGKPPEEVVQEAIRGGLIWGAGDVAFQKAVIPLVGKVVQRYAKRLKTTPATEVIDSIERDVAKDIGVDWEVLNERQRTAIRNIVRRNIEQTQPKEVSGLLYPGADFIAGTRPRVEPKQFKPQTPLNRLSKLIEEIRPEVERQTDQAIKIRGILEKYGAVPAESKRELLKFLKETTNIPKAQFDNMSLQELENVARSIVAGAEPRGMMETARRVARSKGFDLDKEFERAGMTTAQFLKELGERSRLKQIVGLAERPAGVKPPEKVEVPFVQKKEYTPVPETTTAPKPEAPAAIKPPARPTKPPQAQPPLGESAKGQKLRRFPQTVAKGELTAPELKKMIKENPQMYQPISNRETLAVAQRIIDDNFDAAKALVMEGKSFDNATETAMAQDIVRRLQNDKRWDEAFEVMAKASEKLTRAGQTIQAASMWRRMTPEGMLKYTHRVFEEANKQLPAGKKVKVTNDLQKMIFDRMKIIEQMPDGIEKDQAIALLLDEIEGKIPVSLGRKLSTIQAMAHLLNAKTALRNLLGNTSFAVAETISNALAVPIDKVISKYTGKRMVGIPVFKEPFRVAWERAKRAAKEVGMGINVEPGKYELFRGRTFRGGILGALEKGLGYTLRVPDEFYKGFREAQALQQMTRMAGVKEPTEEMLKQAAHEARYAAFQDESLPARLLGGIKEVVNNIGIGKKIPGAYVRSTREFGLGDFIIKYTRVPGNLISRAIEYTPAGALKALSLMAEARRTGVLNQREMSLTLARPLTGSLMIGLGAWLHNKGLLLSEDKERDKDAKALERAEGLGNYKINISAIRRLLAGGDAKPKAGDELYSYNWMEPVSVALAIGATVDAQLKKQGTPAQTANAIGANSVAEILDLPTLYIIKSMVYEGMSDDSTGFTIATVPLAEGIPGFIPSVVRQYAQMTDPTARVTRGETPIETAALKTRANIPGVRRELEPRLSPLGEEITYPTGLVTSMVSPATKSVYTPTEFTKQLKQLEDLTGETGHYPRRDVPTTFTYQKKKIELTPTEQTEYQRIAGQRIKERFTRILGNVDVTKLSDSQRMALVRRLESAIAESREAAKRQVLKGRK